MKERSYIAIDLKAFYASVECTERGLDPLRTNLVVADESRTDKTICLAITPPLKSYGIVLFHVLSVYGLFRGHAVFSYGKNRSGSCLKNLLRLS